MNGASPWLDFWTVVLVAGLGSYYLVVLAVIPLGARDIRRLLVARDAIRAIREHDAASLAHSMPGDEAAKPQSEADPE